jgi:hypothetical protein
VSKTPCAVLDAPLLRVRRHLPDQEGHEVRLDQFVDRHCDFGGLLVVENAGEELRMGRLEALCQYIPRALLMSASFTEFSWSVGDGSSFDRLLR